MAGLSNAEIAALLSLSARTRDHIGSTMLPCLGGDLLSARYGREQWRLEDDRVRRNARAPAVCLEGGECPDAMVVTTWFSIGRLSYHELDGWIPPLARCR